MTKTLSTDADGNVDSWTEFACEVDDPMEFGREVGSSPAGVHTFLMPAKTDRIRVTLIPAGEGKRTDRMRPAHDHEVSIDGTTITVDADRVLEGLYLREDVFADLDTPGMFDVGESCDACGGSGEVDLSVGPERVVECDECGGTGTV